MAKIFPAVFSSLVLSPGSFQDPDVSENYLHAPECPSPGFGNPEKRFQGC
jgi:hypothetical protein